MQRRGSCGVVLTVAQSAPVYARAGLSTTDAFLGLTLTGQGFTLPRLLAALERVCGVCSPRLRPAMTCGRQPCDTDV